jgi:RNA polymerase sigma-70 factor (ECF subfamily)
LSSPSPSGWNEDRCADLIARARSGSSQALDELIGTYRAYLLLVANEELDPRLLGKVAASDVVQEACAAIAHRFDGFQGSREDEWRAWIRQALLHDLQDARRRYVETAKRDLAREVPLEGSCGEREPRHEVLAADPSPRSRLIAEEEAALLDAALQRLPEDYRQVIQLRNWELLPFEDIGQRLNRSAEAARKLWARAIEHLQRELESHERD